MEYTIEHELPGRMRLRCPPGSFSRAEAPVVAALLETQDGVTEARASFRTGSLLIHYEPAFRSSILKAIQIMDRSFYEDIAIEDAGDGPETLNGLLLPMLGGVLARSLLPPVVRAAVALARALPLLRRGAGCLCRRRLSVAVLDASAVGVSLLRRDYRTASVIMTLLKLGDLLESWTHKKSRESLTDSLALHVDRLWVRQDGQEVQIPMSELQAGDLVVVRMGSVIPVDGTVAEGDAMVNQAAMTGESEPVRRTPGLSVYAGTLVEEGELIVRVTAFDSGTRIQKIADMIQDSEAFKAEVQSRAERMADAIVPWSFLLAGGAWALTGSVVRASAALMVDYSCALKLATPLAILAAMREGARHGMLVKGGRFLEALAAADAFVFDKTGTLTVSTPTVTRVIPFEGYSRDEVLRTAACLEEHFPHSIARAVVLQAEREHLAHREKHSTVEYLAAHGIISRIEDQRLLLGSAHFIIEDNGIQPTPEQRAIIDREATRCSVLFLAAGERLAGILCIEDPLRPDARDVIRALHREGVSRVVMLTGDNARAAQAVAEELEVDEVQAQLLPEDKTRIIRELKDRTRGVVMVGDGINDSPALAEADVGVAMRGGADIAREAADMVLMRNELGAILDARRLGAGVMRKIYRNYAWIVGVNSLLLALGLGGVISPAASALLHNLTTVGAGVYSMTPVLKAGPETEAAS